MNEEYFEQIRNLCKACGLSIDKIARQFNINQNLVAKLFMATMQEILDKVEKEKGGKEMFNLNELCVMAYENAAKREAKDGKVSTDTMQMLKHTATEVVEATEAYIDYGYIDKTQSKRVFASELADIVCCVLIIAGKENIDMEYALTACMEKNYKRAIGEGDK